MVSYKALNTIIKSVICFLCRKISSLERRSKTFVVSSCFKDERFILQVDKALIIKRITLAVDMNEKQAL